MSDELSGLEQMLERATAPSDAPHPPLASRSGRPSRVECEGEGYREAWLAFGRLLEAAQPPAAPSLERLRPPPASRRWPLAVAAALAVSLLVGLGVYWFSGGEGVPAIPPPTANKMASANGAKAVPAAVDRMPAPSTAGDLQWDDSLDRQIADAGQEIVLAQSTLASAFDVADFVYRLQQVQQDLAKNKL